MNEYDQVLSVIASLPHPHIYCLNSTSRTNFITKNLKSQYIKKGNTND